MKKDIWTLLIVSILWVFMKIIEYYFIMSLFLIPVFWWFGFSALLFIITAYQLIRLITERKKPSIIRIVKTLFYGLLFYLTFEVKIVAGIIEKADWHILYQKRMEIVEKVQKGELNPNVSWNDYLCELPFEFPIVSMSGNDIGISRNDSAQTITVEFFVIRGMLSSSTFFIYSNDNETLKDFDTMTAENSKRNWKIRENWYRIVKD